VAIFQPNLATGYVQHFDLNIQREVCNTIIDVGYVTRWANLCLARHDQPRVYGDFLNAFWNSP
jgi:hypothetical protein